ncbi:hypothetical protein [Acidovorax sp. Root219]|uniref:hypothetical protein n=1 Tax=Acidovorax sp. Root219 TaxID=1736493 RepID=UPI0012FA715F|nr:hypothetical protein [Acidovorax sp. Root219]
MRKSSDDLNVAARISAVISLHNQENPGVPLSVSSLAKQAGVSRANLYVSHPSVIESLRRQKGRAVALNDGEKTLEKYEGLKAEIEILKKTNAALLLVNGALRDRVWELQKRLNDLDHRKNRR